MIFEGKNRQDMRQFYYASWRKAQNKQTLEPLEKMIVDIISMHPEYHQLLQQQETGIDKDFSSDGAQQNPFLHMGLHISIHEQLSTNQPTGIREVYQQLAAKMTDLHEVEHRMMDCLAEMIWLAQKNNTQPDEKLYLQQLKQLL